MKLRTDLKKVAERIPEGTRSVKNSQKNVTAAEAITFFY